MNFKRKNKTHRAATKTTDEWTTPKNLQRNYNEEKVAKKINHEMKKRDLND